MHQIILHNFIIFSWCNYNKNISCTIKQTSQTYVFKFISRSLSFESNSNVTFSKKIRNSITIKWYCSLLLLHFFKHCNGHFPFFYLALYVSNILHTFPFHKHHWILCCLWKHDKNKNIFFYQMQTHFGTTFF